MRRVPERKAVKRQRARLARAEEVAQQSGMPVRSLHRIGFGEQAIVLRRVLDMALAAGPEDPLIRSHWSSRSAWRPSVGQIAAVLVASRSTGGEPRTSCERTSGGTPLQTSPPVQRMRIEGSRRRTSCLSASDPPVTAAALICCWIARRACPRSSWRPCLSAHRPSRRLFDPIRPPAPWRACKLSSRSAGSLAPPGGFPWTADL